MKPPCDEAVVESGSAASPCQGKQAAWILAATILGSSMAFIDGTVVNVALPALQKSFGASVPGVQWVVEAYGLTLSALILVGGSMGDMFGRRRIFVLGTALFAAASVYCGLAPSLGHLIAARAVQGIGAAFLVPGSLALISASFEESERGRAIGTWSGATAITTALGPVLGGGLIQYLSWRWVFFINVPLALAVIVISSWRVPESRSKHEGRIDWLGALAATFSLTALTFGMIESARLGWSSATCRCRPGCRHRGICCVSVDRVQVRFANGSAAIISVACLQRGEPVDAVSVLGPRHLLLRISNGPHPGAGILVHQSGRCDAATHPADVPSVALVGRPGRSLWGTNAPDHRSQHRCRRDSSCLRYLRWEPAIGLRSFRR